MSYEEKLDWLFRQLPMFSRVGQAAYKPGLERSWALARHFGNPQDKWPSIHIAGTNGKGSVSHLIASTLQSQGYKVGLYTSPHLVDFRERMRVNGTMIPKEPPSHPAFYAMTQSMAFSCLADEQLDYAVIETGMGGRLDSTNIITPLMSVITNISWDHAQFLGDTLPKIAGEKAGIMKPGVPVVIGEAEGDVQHVFRTHAAETGSPIVEAYNKIDEEANAELESVCPLHGDYQHKNINTARVALQQLRNCGIKIADTSILDGFARVMSQTGLRGRWEIISETPLTICDTGHNEAGIRSNVAQLERLLSERARKGDSTPRLRIVMGFVADKDLDHILPLFPGDATYYLTQAQIPRALNYRELHKRVTELGYSATEWPTVREAYEAALADSAPDDILFIGGSTFIVADFLESCNS